MDVQKWEKICRAGKCEILNRVPTKHGNILMAERLVTDKASGERVWETLWAIERDGTDVAQVVRNNLVQEKNGITRATNLEQDRKDRINEALAVAEQFIKDNLKVGRYT